MSRSGTSATGRALPDRTADTLAQWLRTHPGVRMLCRDRAGMYAEGARSGAPRAQQVADRFHLLRNLAETLEQVFHQHRPVLKDLHVPSAVLPLTIADQPSVVEESSPRPTARNEAIPLSCEGVSQRRTHQRRRYEQVCQLARQGRTFRAIAQQVGPPQLPSEARQD